MRVINTQATPQTFFQYTVQPGYMRSITNCNALLTTPCAASVTAAVGTGINGPANGIVFNSQYVYAGADAYGNVYQLNGTGGSIAVPGYYENVGYAGGAPLTSLLTAEVPTLSSVYSATETAYPVPSSDSKTPNELPLTYGNIYVDISNPSLNSALPSGFLNVIVTTTNEFAHSAGFGQARQLWQPLRLRRPLSGNQSNRPVHRGWDPSQFELGWDGESLSHRSLASTTLRT